MTTPVSTSSSSTGSISLSGLLGGTAGSIDVTSLVSQLMTAAAVPQGQLYDQLNTAQLKAGIFQTINAKLTSLQTAAQAITDPTLWTSTAASSSDTSVVATSTGQATTGSTTFDVIATAKGQISTIAADSSGNVISGVPPTFTINGTAISPAAADAQSVADAINASSSGVRANVVNTSSSNVLQLWSTSVGAANGSTANGSFTLTATGSSSFLTGANAPTVVQAAQDASISIDNGAYTVTSSSNTFTNVIPGVTFTVSKPTTGVTIGVSQDQAGIAAKIKTLVDTANTVQSELANDTQQGSPLQGTSALNSLLSGLGFSVSLGTSAAGGSLATYGIDIDKNGVFSFNADTFNKAYSSDPAAAQQAATDFANRLNGVANEGIDPTAGSITETLAEITANETNLNSSIASWTDRLSQMKDALNAKFIAMQTTLAMLNSQQTYLTSAFASLSNSSSSSKSSS
jgi:flagellar hook-associated protein 2